MAAGSTDTTICNRALAECVGRYTLTGTAPNFDSSAAAQACALLYQPAWQMMLRQQDTEFSRRTVSLTAAGTPTYPWSNAYQYPDDCLKIRSVVPATWDPNDPQPVRWSEQDQVIATVPTRIILTNVPNAELVYTTSSVTPAIWDTNFEEAVVRFLASQLALAIAGRPDLSRTLLGQAGSILQSGDLKDS